MTMKSLKQRSLEAYEAGVVSPGFIGWGSLNKQCGCALTAIVLHEVPEAFPTLESVLNVTGTGSYEICEVVGISYLYSLGFTDAFDGYSHGTSHITTPVFRGAMDDQQEYDAGYKMGKETREAVFDKYFPDGYVLTEGETGA